MSPRLRPLFLTLAAIGFLGLVAVAILVAPPLFVPDDPELTLQELYQERNAVRTTLLQAVAGLVLLLGAYFTYRQVQNSTRQAENSTRALQHTQEQIEIARSGQVTERFTRAIDQLGSDKLDVRLGGIYALERIARDSADDRATVAEVLCAYVREHAPWPPTRPGQYVAHASHEKVPTLQTRAPDIQAILTVIGRGEFTSNQTARIDLNKVDLRRADLGGMNLRGADLHEACLRWANVGASNLRQADLNWTNLAGSNLSGTNLSGADLGAANLSAATLNGADLHEANLRRADLAWSDMRGADLRGAKLHWTDLRGAKLQEADLQGANAANETQWPDGFNWQAAGVIMDPAEGPEVDGIHENQASK